MDLVAHQIVNRSRAREDDTGAQNRASFDDSAFVNAAIAADERFVLDDDGERSDRLENASDLRRSR
jgi:hypothetical protein